MVSLPFARDYYETESIQIEVCSRLSLLRWAFNSTRYFLHSIARTLCASALIALIVHLCTYHFHRSTLGFQHTWHHSYSGVANAHGERKQSEEMCCHSFIACMRAINNIPDFLSASTNWNRGARGDSEQAYASNMRCRDECRSHVRWQPKMCIVNATAPSDDRKIFVVRQVAARALHRCGHWAYRQPAGQLDDTGAHIPR